MNQSRNSILWDRWLTVVFDMLEATYFWCLLSGPKPIISFFHWRTADILGGFSFGGVFNFLENREANSNVAVILDSIQV